VILPSSDLMNFLKQKKGVFWIRKEITIADRPDTDLAFLASEILNADETYFNGELIGRSGRFPPDFRTTWQEFRNYRINKDLIRNGKNVLAMRIYHDAECWVIGPLELSDTNTGNNRKMFYDFFRNDMPSCLSFLLVFISFFFMIYYLKMKEEKEYLYFSLFCLSIAVSIIPQMIERNYRWLPFSSEMILALTQSGVINFAPLYLVFLLYYITGRLNGLLKWALLLPTLAASVFMIASDDRTTIITTRNIFLYYLVLMIASIISVLGYGVIKSIRRSFILFISILPVFLFSLHDIAVFRFGLFNDRISFYIYGLPMIVIIFTYHFILNHVNYIRENEKLRIESLKLMENFNKAVLLVDCHGMIVHGNERAGTLLKRDFSGKNNDYLFSLFENNRELPGIFNESVSKRRKNNLISTHNEQHEEFYIEIEPVLLKNDGLEHLIIIIEENIFSSFKSDYELTTQELNIIFHVVDGKLNKEIASILEIKTDTVKKHITSIYRKTGADNRVSLSNLINNHKKN
jgi:DNA-binding CsgD family transcriptional regulator